MNVVSTERVSEIRFVWKEEAIPYMFQPITGALFCYLAPCRLVDK